MSKLAALTTDEIKSKLASLEGRWKAFRDAVDEDGGIGGDPGEWMHEEMEALQSELNRREGGNP